MILQSNESHNKCYIYIITFVFLESWVRTIECALITIVSTLHVIREMSLELWNVCKWSHYINRGIRWSMWWRGKGIFLEGYEFFLLGFRHGLSKISKIELNTDENQTQHLPFGHINSCSPAHVFFFSQTSHQKAWISSTVTITLKK